VATVNGEFQVGTYTSYTREPKISALSDGGFVIAWNGRDQNDFSGVSGGVSGQRYDANGGVFAQRYDANGAVNDVEFQVNTFTTSHQNLSSIDGLSDGGFVVTWGSHEQASINRKWGVYGQRYDANGAVSGAEFVVRSDASDRAIDSNTTALSDGSFVVIWDYYRGINQGTSGQHYDVNGAASGTEFIHRFASSFNNNGNYPFYEVTALRPGHAFGGYDGGFVVTWDYRHWNPLLKGTYAQYYDANAAASSNAFLVDSKIGIVALSDGGFISTDSHRYDVNGDAIWYINKTFEGSSTTALSDGGFVVNYPKYGKDGYKEGVYAQRYEANGAGSGAEFKVYTASETTVQSSIDFAALSDGGLVATWHSSPISTAYPNVYAKRYDSEGITIGLPQPIINEYTNITTYTDTIQKVFIAYYGRAADPVGLAYWEAQLASNNGDLASIMNSFGSSEEAAALFGNLSNTNKVNTLYQQMFGRDADVAGLMYYAGQLTAGTMTAVSIAQNIFDGSSGADATILTNKLAVAKYFTSAIDTVSEIVSYAGDAAAASARAMLATVSATTVPASFNVDTTIAGLATEAATTATAAAAAKTANVDAYAAALVTYDAAVVKAAASKELSDAADDDVVSVTNATSFKNYAITADTDAKAVVVAAAALTTTAAATPSIIDDATAVTNNVSAADAAAAAATALTTANSALTTAIAAADTAETAAEKASIAKAASEIINTTKLSVTFEDPSGQFTAYFELIEANVLAAWSNWDKYINGHPDASLEIVVKIQNDPEFRSGTMATAFNAWMEKGRFLTSHLAEEVSTGIDGNGVDRDGTISINSDYLMSVTGHYMPPDTGSSNEGYFDFLGATTAAGKTNFQDLMTHELGHLLGFFGNPNIIMSPFDQFVNKTRNTFDGENAVSAQGGLVYLDSSQWHLANSFPMMGPYIRRDEKAEITLTEVGILADLGIPIHDQFLV
jgi:hypothetical protein